MQVSEPPPSRAHPTAWQPPERFAEYRIQRPLGRGAMGQVFLAHDTLLDRAVAVKFLFAHHHSIAARQRFLVEARAAARLHHPNVVSVFRVGELGEHLYLVSELVTGQSLDRIARPVAWPKIASIALDLARGLAVAHRRGVLHRDIKPANAIMAETGEVKLLDFGLAKLADGSEPAVRDMELASHEAVGNTLLPADVSHAGIAIAPPIQIASLARLAGSPSALSDGIVGTPLYMAPEIWRGEPATPRSDIYSLGVLLYELCADRVPHRAATVADLARIVTETDAEPLSRHAPDHHAAFAAVVDRCVRRDPAERFASIDDLRLAIERLVPATMVAAARPAGNPYRGLAAFEAEHRALYFGREREIRVVSERLVADPFVLVAGDSGVGKSSLCRAGVIPAIEQGALGESFAVVTLVPGRRPVATFASVLAPIVDDSEAAVAAVLRDDPDVLARRIRVGLGTRRMLLFVDQLEELVTLAPEDEAASAAALLAALAVRSPQLRLLATVRGDFLTRLARLPAFAGEIERAIYLLAPLEPDALRDVIVGPARVARVRFESDALVDELVADTAVEDAALPLLQFALAQLWDARDRTTDTITRASVVAIGGVAGALARHAEHVVAALLPGPRRAAARVLVRLVSAAGTRTRKSETELVPADAGTGADARSALDALVRGRLVVAREDDAGTSYELAHEALIASWSSLREWMHDEGGRRAVEERLAAATAEWIRAGKTRDVLWSKRQLREAETLAASELSASELEFLARSRRAIRRRSWLPILLAATLLIALGVTWWLVGVEQARATARRVAEQVATADTVLASARTRRSEVERLRDDALARFDRNDIAEAETRWARAHALQAEIDRALSTASQALEAALVVDQSRLDIRDRLADVLYQRADDAERWHRDESLDELLQRLRLYDRRGTYVARWQAAAQLSLRSTPTLAARIELLRYERVRDAAWRTVPVRELASPSATVSLVPGSYLVRVQLADGRTVPYPVLLERGQHVTLELAPPAPVPAGFSYVPPGETLFGTNASEQLRKSFFLAHPQHRRFVDAFAIARYETTYAEWIAFLEALPAAERDKRRPHFQNVRGLVDLRRGNDGWTLTLQPSSRAVTAKQGEPLVLSGRDRRVAQDWLRLPVSGVALDDARAYAAWLRDTKRVPGARLCRELEWERAARGADDRLYPHGDGLAIDDANIDHTYGRNPLGFGPDEVGSHPASASPFGVQDLVGNVFEWVESDEGFHLRGSSYYFDSLTAVANNRAPSEPGMRDPTLGVRICADVPR